MLSCGVQAVKGEIRMLFKPWVTYVHAFVAAGCLGVVLEEHGYEHRPLSSLLLVLVRISWCGLYGLKCSE